MLEDDITESQTSMHFHKPKLSDRSKLDPIPTIPTDIAEYLPNSIHIRYTDTAPVPYRHAIYIYIHIYQLYFPIATTTTNNNQATNYMTI